MNQVRIEDEAVIQAPVAVVWEQIKDTERHAAWHPFLTAIGGEHELGAARVCEVAIGRRTARTRERCVTEEREARIAWLIEQDTSGFMRFVSDWTAGFRLEPVDATATRVTAESAFTPRNLMARAMLPVVRRKFHQTQRAILDSLDEATRAA